MPHKVWTETILDKHLSYISSLEALLYTWPPTKNTLNTLFFFLGSESTQLARQVKHPTRKEKKTNTILLFYMYPVCIPSSVTLFFLQ